MNEIELIRISEEQIDALYEKLDKKLDLKDDDYELIKALIKTVVNLNKELENKKLSIKRLKKIFKIETEKRKNILPDHDKEKKANEKKQKKTKKGHGRIGASMYKGAERILINHKYLKKGDICPKCNKGKLYDNIKPGVFVRITGKSPLKATVYEQEKLRCNLCGEIFTAPLPDGIEKKYDEKACAMIAILKYGTGVPFYRLSQLQKSLDIPLPPTTQWDIIEENVDNINPVYEYLVHMAAQGEIFHNDDTNMKILSLLKENKENEDLKRKGIFTTGIIAVVDKREIVLYFTGRNHAGENLTNVLKKRLSGKDPPIQMCDGLSRNLPDNFKVLLANCLAHGRRRFVDLVDNFPEECKYVIDLLAEVYHNDSIAKKENMSAEHRLVFHQEKSSPYMQELKEWMIEQFYQKKVEPNSSLGNAIQYMMAHWDALTLFLREPGAPLDNTILERALKKVILHRKNALFYKTEFGALAGDIFMSIIETCRLARINAFNYLVAILKNSKKVKQDPSSWLPWNYTATLSLINSTAKA